MHVWHRLLKSLFLDNASCHAIFFNDFFPFLANIIHDSKTCFITSDCAFFGVSCGRVIISLWNEQIDFTKHISLGVDFELCKPGWKNRYDRIRTDNFIHVWHGMKLCKYNSVSTCIDVYRVLVLLVLIRYTEIGT